MRRLFVAGVAQAPKGGIDGVIRHGALARTKGWKEIASTPVERLKLTQYRYSLARERHDVWLPHLHPRSGDTPFRIRQVKLGPLCCAQFARADKDQRSELQCQCSYRVSGIAIDRPHEFADAHWIEHRGAVLGLHRRQRVLEVRCYIVLRTTRRHRVAKHPPSQGANAVRGFVLAPRLDPAQRSEQLL